MKRRSNGLTLVELMVSLALGLIIILASIYLYLAASANSRVSRAQARLTSDSATIMQSIGSHLRMAGFSTARLRTGTAADSKAMEGHALRGCDGPFADAKAPGLPACIPGASGPDALEVAYEADRFNAHLAGSSVLDCSAAPVAPVPIASGMFLANAAGDALERVVLRNRFYVASSNGSTQLRCAGNGGAIPFESGTTIANGVEDFQVTYSTAVQAPAPGQAQVSASDVPKLYATEEEAWRNVRVVRICLVIASPPGVLSTPAPHIGCDGQPVTVPDTRLRRRFESSFALRNQLEPGL